MEDTLFSRLDQFMQYKGLNDNRITVQTNIAVGTLGKQRRNGKGLSYDSIVKILTTYPELNPSWLIIGKGDMLLREDNNNINIESLMKIIAQQESILKKQQEKINLLISQSDYMRTQLSVNNELCQEIVKLLESKK